MEMLLAWFVPHLLGVKKSLLRTYSTFLNVVYCKKITLEFIFRYMPARKMAITHR